MRNKISSRRVRRQCSDGPALDRNPFKQVRSAKPVSAGANPAAEHVTTGFVERRPSCQAPWAQTLHTGKRPALKSMTITRSRKAGIRTVDPVPRWVPHCKRHANTRAKTANLLRLNMHSRAVKHNL